jgi:hypothetical protein
MRYYALLFIYYCLGKRHFLFEMNTQEIYGTRRFIIVCARARNWTLASDISIQNRQLRNRICSVAKKNMISLTAYKRGNFSDTPVWRRSLSSGYSHLRMRSLQSLVHWFLLFLVSIFQNPHIVSRRRNFFMFVRAVKKQYNCEV